MGLADISHGNSSQRPSIVIDAEASWLFVDWSEYWQKRDLFWVLVARDIRVRFKQALLGTTWAILKPLALMLVFTLFLGYMVRFPSGGIPYPIFFYSGLVFWNYFVTSVNLSSESLLSNAGLLSKVYCPILYIPATPVAAQAVDLVASFATLVALTLFYGIWPSAKMLIIPALLLIVVATTLGTGLLLAPLIAKYRDFQNVMLVLTQIWFFSSPVIYPMKLVPEKWKLLYSFNPMVGAIEGLRWAMIGHAPFPALPVLLAAFTSILMLSVGFFFFMRNTESIVDVV